MRLGATPVTTDAMADTADEVALGGPETNQGNYCHLFGGLTKFRDILKLNRSYYGRIMFSLKSVVNNPSLYNASRNCHIHAL